MSTKDELETRLYERMSQENKAFLTEMKAKSPDEIISHAYEIACRDNLLLLFENETGLSERQLAVLNEFEHPLSQLYTDWLSRDTDEMDAFRDSIACCANDILRKRVEEKYRDPAQPIYPNTRSEAVVRGEVFEWMASRASFICSPVESPFAQQCESILVYSETGTPSMAFKASASFTA